jgi:hypothetical protein
MRLRLALVLLVLALAGCGRDAAQVGAGPVSAPPAPSPAAAEKPAATGPRERPLSLAIGYLRRETQRKRAYELWRRAELAKARRSRTVAGALRRALLARHIGRAEHDRLRDLYERARADAGRLPGLRGSELHAVVGSVDALAESRRLTAGRFAPVFLTLRRNDEFWPAAPMPAPGQRETFGDDPAVFQYYPGRGMQLQQLASWGRVNAKLGVCIAPRKRKQRDLIAAMGGGSKGACAKTALRRALDRLVALGAQRDRFVAWEYYFSFGGGTPPWISGMTQATAVSALARAGRALHEPRWHRLAHRALGAFHAPPPLGVDGGDHFLMYSFAPSLRIFNGELQAVSGLGEVARLARDRLARRLFRRGEPAARRMVAAADTGAWSLYSWAGREATLSYHQLIARFLGDMCGHTARRVYCSAHRRFTRYEHEPTRIGIAPLRRLRARHATTVRFSISKLSAVKVRVVGRHGLAFSRDMELPYGRHEMAWTPPARGRFRLYIEAQGPSGPVGVAKRRLAVRLPRPKPKKRGRKGEKPPVRPETATPDETLTPRKERERVSR